MRRSRRYPRPSRSSHAARQDVHPRARYPGASPRENGGSRRSQGADVQPDPPGDVGRQPLRGDDIDLEPEQVGQFQLQPGQVIEGRVLKRIDQEIEIAALRILTARGLRAFADGFVSLLLPIYLVELGFSALAIGAIVTSTLIGTALLTLWVGLIANRYSRRRLRPTRSCRSLLPPSLRRSSRGPPATPSRRAAGRPRGPKRTPSCCGPPPS